jgi:hypothetical protein
MFRVWLTAFVLGAMASGVGAAQTLEADLRLPGAEARLGWGGGFVSGAWSELRLTATGSEAYTVTLETNDGTLRSGLTPLTASLEVAAGTGVRSEVMLVPLFVKRPVKLTLKSSVGSQSVKLEPFSQIPEVNEAASSPAAYLGGAKLSGDLEPSAALVALAGGALVAGASGLERLPQGVIGMGALGLNARDLDEGARGGRNLSPSALANLAGTFVTDAAPPPRASQGLALWCVAAFVALLALYSARRLDWRFSVAGGVIALVIGAVGFAALQPEAFHAERNQTVLIGARGWGLQLEVRSRFNTRGGEGRLEAGSQPLEAIRRHYTQDGTRITVKPWSRLAYWTAPKAARVPLRVSSRWIENSGSERMENIYVVGHGLLEPMSATRRELGVATGAFAPQEYDAFSRLLPQGTAVAKLRDTIVIALPEQP